MALILLQFTQDNNKEKNTMIKVEKTAKTLDEGIKNLMAGAKLD